MTVVATVEERQLKGGILKRSLCGDDCGAPLEDRSPIVDDLENLDVVFRPLSVGLAVSKADSTGGGSDAIGQMTDHIRE